MVSRLVSTDDATNYLDSVAGAVNSLEADFQVIDRYEEYEAWTIDAQKWYLARSAASGENAAYWASEQGFTDTADRVTAFEGWQDHIAGCWKVKAVACGKVTVSPSPGITRLAIAEEIVKCAAKVRVPFLQLHNLHVQYSNFRVSFLAYRAKNFPKGWTVETNNVVASIVPWDRRVIDWRKVYAKKTGLTPSLTYASKPAPPGDLLDMGAQGVITTALVVAAGIGAAWLYGRSKGVV